MSAASFIPTYSSSALTFSAVNPTLFLLKPTTVQFVPLLTVNFLLHAIYKAVPIVIN
jgi:hypothetical protein